LNLRESIQPGQRPKFYGLQRIGRKIERDSGGHREISGLVTTAIAVTIASAPVDGSGARR